MANQTLVHPAKMAKITSPHKEGRRPRSFSNVSMRSWCAGTQLNVYARLPASSPYVGSFHYAPSAGNRAYSFFEGQIIPHYETERLHKIKSNPLTGNFHSRPGHYSRLHGLQNFRSENEGSSAAEDGGMTAIIARIKNTLTQPSSPAVAEATAMNKLEVCAKNTRFRSLPQAADLPHVPTHARTLSGLHTPHSACDALAAAAAAAGEAEPKESTGRATVYSKYWEEVDTERGRFGSSVDDNAVGASFQRTAAGAAAADGRMVAAAEAAGVRGLGKGGVHWGKHHHHHSLGGEEASEHLIGDATSKFRHIYFQKNHTKKPSSLLAAHQRNRIQATIAEHSVHAGARHGHGSVNAIRDAAWDRPTLLTTHRSLPGGLVSAAPDVSGGGLGGVRRATYTAQGWESHTVKAQQKTEEYMQGREDLAPDMRPDVVLDNKVSLAYDVDVSDAGMLGAGAYGTVLAAMHRSTGRQVAIKTMLKKYLFSDAEKASVEREIELQQRLVNNHVIRLYEIYQSPEKLYLVVERAPCGTLEEFLYLRRRMTELDAKRVVRQLLDGLAYLHKVGVVHCDLKPANILFSDIDQGTAAASADVASGDGAGQPMGPRPRSTTPPASLSGLVVKICDFGHARKVPDCRYYKFTGDINKIPFHMFKHTGTEGFVAPEVLKSESYGKAADMWSTGCMLYQMLTGRMPWIPSRACLQRPLSTSGPSWKGISEQAKCLVGDLLMADQDYRADVEQATHHPWFEGIHHCARMPTSAPGGKGSFLSPPLKGRAGHRVLVPPLSESATARAVKGVLGGDVAAGGGASPRLPEVPACKESVQTTLAGADASTSGPSATRGIALDVSAVAVA